ncbi:MAG: hypothetical protein EHM18_14020 [Acidobacteria bacterium]|nr:MAG: hypothetical protein EHM18_14020 [Acidobacteriota bacterium]
MKPALKVLVVLVLLYAVVCIGLLAAMYQPPARFGKIMAKIENPVVFMLFPFKRLWFIARGGDLNPGDVAPDFALERQNARNETIRLSSFQGDRPVVLVFGSYT